MVVMLIMEKLYIAVAASVLFISHHSIILQYEYN